MQKEYGLRGPISWGRPAPPLPSCGPEQVSSSRSLGFLACKMGVLVALEGFCED